MLPFKAFTQLEEISFVFQPQPAQTDNVRMAPYRTPRHSENGHGDGQGLGSTCCKHLDLEAGCGPLSFPASCFVLCMMIKGTGAQPRLCAISSCSVLLTSGPNSGQTLMLSWYYVHALDRSYAFSARSGRRQILKSQKMAKKHLPSSTHCLLPSCSIAPCLLSSASEILSLLPTVIVKKKLFA